MLRITCFLLCLTLLESVAAAQGVELGQPRLRLRLEGGTGRWLDAVVEHWLLRAPNANPGMIEMFRLRDRQPPYENPVPWAGEFAGKYLISAIQARRMTADPSLDAMLHELIPELIATQGEDGYLGPFVDKRLLAYWDLWGHYHVMLALYMWYSDTGDQAALDAALRAADLLCATFLDSDHRVYDAGSHEMNTAIIHILGLLHRQTGRQRYFRLMKEIEKDWERPPAGDYYRTGVEGIEYYLTPKPRWESLHPMQGLEELYLITGDDSYKQALLNHWHSIYRNDVHNSGSFSTNEQALGNPFKPGAIETCCTVAWMAYSISALRLSADSIIADAIELATWNAVLGYQHPSGSWCTYDTPMNGKRLASAHAIVFQARPGTPELNCCSVNGPRGLGMISEWAILGDAQGLYLNYYGPGTIQATLDDGSTWDFSQETRYPADGAIRIKVTPPSPVQVPLHVRIPAWSSDSAVSVNGHQVAGVVPGTYLTIERTWAQGDVIELALDMGVRALRGDEHVGFNTSLFKGPILLAFDQKHNTIEPDDIPALDLKDLEIEPATCEARFQPMVLVKTTATDGQQVYLCDFATAGAHGTAYRSWLPVTNAPPVAVRLRYPEDHAHLPVEEVWLSWSSAGPGATYTLTVAADEAMTRIVHRLRDLAEPRVLLSMDLEPGRAYYWQVKTQADDSALGGADGPRTFVLDPAVESSMKGVVLRAPLTGSADPVEGKLLDNVETAPAAGPHGNEAGALHFNGVTSKLVYEAPRFPLRTYTFSAWVCPEGMEAGDTAWHQIFSAWHGPLMDPLRVSVKAKQLVVNIEQPAGNVHLPGPRVENGAWLHVAVVKESDELRLYINSEHVHSVAAPPCLTGAPKNIGVGCNPNFGDIEGFRGALSEVLFQREALTPAEVQKLYQASRE